VPKIQERIEGSARKNVSADTTHCTSEANDESPAEPKSFQRGRPAFYKSQARIAIGLSWWIVPVALSFLWGRYLRAQDWRGTGLHVLVISVTAAFGVALFYTALATLRGNELQCLRRRRFGVSILSALGVAGLLLFISYGAINGIRPGDANGIRPGDSDFSTFDPAFGSIEEAVPSAIAILLGSRYSTFANLREKDVSTKPATWTGDPNKSKEELPLVKPADLHGRRLRYAYADGAFLVRADLREADLSGASLREADLRQAKLNQARLDNAHLDGAHLDGADLESATLTTPIYQAPTYRKRWVSPRISLQQHAEMEPPSCPRE
jgi:hypothetical protein